MELKIRNVNKIKSADIQLNGLTVIVGEMILERVLLGVYFFLPLRHWLTRK